MKRQAPSFQANPEPLGCFSQEEGHEVALVDVVALVVAVVEGLAALAAAEREWAQVLRDNLRYQCTSWLNQCCISPRSPHSCHMLCHRPTCSNNIAQ